MKSQVVLRVVAWTFIPFILTYALYVQFHGDFGPGGGFQAGVIFAAAFIVYALVGDLETARRIVPPRALELLMALGVVLFVGTGFVTLLLGGADGYNFLGYSAIDPKDPAHGQHLGILAVELGVGITVTAVMLSIFFSFAGWGGDHDVGAEDE